MSTSGVENLLSQALKNLSAEWQETRDHWRDRKAAEFEKEYLEPLPQHVAQGGQRHQGAECRAAAGQERL